MLLEGAKGAPLSLDARTRLCTRTSACSDRPLPALGESDVLEDATAIEPVAMKRLCPIVSVLTTLLVIGCGLQKTNDERTRRFGTMADAVSNEANFNSICGDRDFARCPLKYPFHLVDINKRMVICRLTTVVLEGVAWISVGTNAMGGMIQSNGRTKYFSLSFADEQTTLFEERELWLTKMKELGVDPGKSLECRELIRAFAKQK